MAKQQSTAMGDLTPTLKWGTVYAYGACGLGSWSPYLVFQAYYLMFFLTEVLGLNTYVAATIYTVTQWIKVVTMMGAGVAIDSIPLKGGKYRPWMRWMAILLFVAFVPMWANFGLGQVASIVVFIILFTISMFAYNTMWVANRGMIGPMAKNSLDASMIAQGQQVASSAIGIVNGVFYVWVINLCVAHFPVKFAYSVAAAVFTGIILLTMIPLQAITKKYDLPPEEKAQKSDAPKAKKVGFIDMLKTMSGPMIPYFFSQSISIARDGFFYALLTYFTTYVLNNPMVMGYANTLQSVGGLIGAMFITTVEKTFGRKWGYIYGLFAQAVLFVLIAYFGGTAAGFLIIRTVIAVVTGATGAFAAVQANDIADWQIMHGKADARAFIQSLSGTTVRVGGVLGSMISSFGLAALGYQAGTVPSETVLKGMINLLAWGPSAVCLIAAVIFMFYKIDDKALNEWRAERDAAKEAE